MRIRSSCALIRLRRWSVHLTRGMGKAAQGFIYGSLVGLALWRLGAFPLGLGLMLIGGLAGAVLWFTRLRLVMGAVGGVAVGLLLAIGYTPVMPRLAARLERRDLLQERAAVVVLGSYAFADGILSDQAQARACEGFEVLRSHHARRLVLTRPPPPEVPWDGIIVQQMHRLGIDVPVDVVGPAANTHEEAIRVAELARRNGWDSVILVTHPWHMRRAAACFEKQGLRVVCAPCDEGRYDWGRLNDESDRVRCFHDWLHEFIGFEVYRWRGWV